jgi:hypothetical protein
MGNFEKSFLSVLIIGFFISVVMLFKTVIDGGYESIGKNESDFIDYNGNKISFDDYERFDYNVFINNVDDFRLNYVYLIDENKNKRYLGECLYFEEIIYNETNSTLDGYSLTLLGEIKGKSIKNVKDGNIKLYMIEHNPFRWYTMIVPVKSIYLITGKYIKDINEFTL